MQEDDFICNSKNFMEDFLKAKKQESFKQCLEKYKKVDNFFNILKSNNILHRIAELKGKQKCGFLDELINHVNPEDLIKLINNKDERQKTPMRIAFENKVLKEKHRSSEISDNDNTYQFILKLIKYGADSNQLTLPNETLKNLPKDCYYYKLKEKLNGPIVEHKKSEKQKNETSITKSDIYLAKQEQNPDEIRNTLNDGNNILHQIVLLEGDQKCKRLDELVELKKQKDLAELISSKNGKGKTPLQTLLFAKVEKKEHESENKIIKVVKATLKLLREYDDNTIECAVKLLMLGANINDLKLTIDKEEDKKYYHNFLKKLKKSVEESKDLDKTMKKGIIINIEKVISNEYPLHSAVKRQNLEEFSSFLKNGHNITVIDQERNNIIHKAALLPKRRKVKFLTKILNLVKENQIPEEDFKTAVNAQNSDNKTPMQVALSKKAKNNWKTYIPFKNNYTAEFCTMLLENGAEDKQLQSSVPSGQLSKRHYETVKEINRHYQTPTGNQIVKEYKRTHSKTFPIKTITTFLTLAIVSSIA